ncbi:MAG: transposase [Armatimonadetes bacterium]|nr:transposase [Armatimonadota bacterium]
MTFRLADSLPQTTLDQMHEELKRVRKNLNEELVRRMEAHLDQGIGSCILAEPKCAQIVQDSLIWLHERSFHLVAWVVMPNHVHFLAYIDEGQSLSKALHSLKSFTGHELKRLHPEHETVWQSESFDRYIRTEDHFLSRIQYIHENPVMARLCDRAEDYPWSSASAKWNNP